MSTKNKRDAVNVFDSYLTRDETILWLGRPNPRWLLSSSDLFLIPFSLLWGGFAITWELGVLNNTTPGFFALWGIPFVLVGQYLIWGRFIHKYFRRKNTYYALTEKRALVLNKLFRTSLKTYFLNQLGSLDHRGQSILFGSSDAFGFWNSRQQDWSGEGQPGFYSIADADDVYRAMQELMMQQSKSA